MAISQATLLSKAMNFSSGMRSFSEKVATENLSNKRTAFLCHSHNDAELVKGLLVVFKEAGLDLYVDWQDHSMPETPNGETARRIQDRIKGSDVFLFFATANSKASRWCPWEIGYADSSSRGIYIIPTADGTGTYGNEYLQLYPKIDSGIRRFDQAQGYAVFQPGASDGSWLNNSTLS